MVLRRRREGAERIAAVRAIPPVDGQVPHALVTATFASG